MWGARLFIPYVIGGRRSDSKDSCNWAFHSLLLFSPETLIHVADLIVITINGLLFLGEIVQIVWNIRRINIEKEKRG